MHTLLCLNLHDFDFLYLKTCPYIADVRILLKTSSQIFYNFKQCDLLKYIYLCDCADKIVLCD